MSDLLDANLVTGLRRSKRQADAAVRQWVSARKPADLWLSVVTVLKVELGIARLGHRDVEQAQRLRTWLEDDLLAVFEGRILSIDVPVAQRAARLHVPDPRPDRDALIAARAAVHGLTVITRNVATSNRGAALINRWSHVGG